MKKISLMAAMIYLISISLNFSQNTYADTHPETTYTMPDIIASTDLSQADNIEKILSSEELKRDLRAFARSLTQSDIVKQSLFNRIALLSLRDELDHINETVTQSNLGVEFIHYQLFHQTCLALKNKTRTQPAFADETQGLQGLIAHQFERLSDEEFVQMSLALGWSVPNAERYVVNVYKQLQGKRLLSQSDMMNIAVNTHLYHVLNTVIPVANKVIKQEQDRRFIIQPDVLITLENDIELSATIVRRRDQKMPNTTALQFTIYADEKAHIKTAMHAAAHGYIGMVANSRGKRSSSNAIVPWEREGEDAAALIHWITKQQWSNKNVVMYGGSYNGFTQWATAKHMPKGLKAMAPYVAANLITGLPYENNIALTGNFQWPLYVTNNKMVDNSVYNDWQRTNAVISELYTSGRPMVDIDDIANRPSPWLQKWLAHPEDDAFYQRMVPHQEEYKAIDVPVLTITGYFEGGQISALNYLNEHYKYNDQANHALLIGPYNHWSAQNKPRSHHGNYKLDPVALEKDTEEVVFAWFDHLLKGAKKPTLVQSKVNYQVMGANEWRFADSLRELNQHTVSFYIQTNTPNKMQTYSLGRVVPLRSQQYIEQVIDLADRSEQRNLAPRQVIGSRIDKQGGIQIETDVFEQDMELTGAITGYFDIEVNKHDVDIGFNYYEVTRNGEVFHLNNYRSRASYADDMGSRRLLAPHKKRRVPIVNARFTSKLIEKGSKLVLVLNVNKNMDAQVNLGTGKAVNHEDISQAGEPLTLKWYLSSQINLPLKPWVKSE